MKIRLYEGLPFVSVEVTFRQQKRTFDNCLLDTGSAGTIFSADQLLPIGLAHEPDDEIHRIRGVGGAEFVFTKTVDSLQLGSLIVENFEIEVGAMDYGFTINGIVGLDFLIAVDAIIDLNQLQIISPIQI